MVKNILAVVLLIAAGGSLYLSLFEEDPRERRRREALHRAPVESDDDEDEKVTKQKKPAQKGKQETEALTELTDKQTEHIRAIARAPWGSHVFIRMPPPAEKKRKRQLSVRPSQQLNLEFSFFNGKEWVASINRRLVRKGDVLGEERVVHIDKNRVILDSDYGRRQLSVQASTIEFSVGAQKEKRKK